MKTYILQILNYSRKYKLLYEYHIKLTEEKVGGWKSCDTVPFGLVWWMCHSAVPYVNTEKNMLLFIYSFWLVLHYQP